MFKRGLIVGIIVLFIASSLIPLAIGNNAKIRNAEPTELDKHLANLAFICTEPNGFNSVRYEHYKQQLMKQYSSENNYNKDEVKTEDVIIQNEPKSSSLSFGPMNSPWPMFAHDNNHTSQSPYSTANNPGLEKWRFYNSGWCEGTPAIANDGTIYFTGAYNWLDRYIYAIYPNGTEKWKYKADDLILWSSPAIAQDGTIYIGCWDAKLYAINPNGTLKWKGGGGGSIASSPAIGEDGSIYYGDCNGYIQALYPNGTRKWIYQTGSNIYSNPAIGDDGTIYIGSNDKYLYAMNPNGTLKWRFREGTEVGSGPSIAPDGAIYTSGTWDNYLYALYPNGTIKWKCGISVNSNPSIGSDGTIYIGGNEKLYAVFPNGTIKWTFNLGSSRWTAGTCPAISADGTIYVSMNIGTNDNGGEIVAVNPNGTERWRKWLARYHIVSSPSISEDGTVYIGSSYDMSGGYLHAFGVVENNEPPSAPIITGPARGKVGETYTYNFVSIDPENYPLKYYVDWGDGAISDSTWVYDSGKEVQISHTWSEQGTYTIKAKTMDISNYESDWGYLEVKVPLNLQMSKSNNQLRLIFFVQVQYSGLLPGVNYSLKGVQNSGLFHF